MNEWKSRDAQRRMLKGSVMLDLQAIIVPGAMKCENGREDPRASRVSRQGQGWLSGEEKSQQGKV